MTPLPSDLAPLVYRRIEGRDFGELSIDSNMLNVLIGLDGRKSVADIAREKGMRMNVIRDALNRLLEYGLVEPADRAVRTLDGGFLQYLTLQMSQHVGPIAGILIEDAAKILGHPVQQIPVQRAAELVDLLSKEIQNEEKRNDFKKNMVGRIKAL